MWELNKDTNKWTERKDNLETSDFKSYKQDIKSLRFYQKYLSGSTYIGMSDIDNIYDILGNRKQLSYNYNSFFSPYVSNYSNLVVNESAISSTASQNEFINKYLPEYGYTLKNLFTPTRLIDDQIKNLLYVDLATTEPILNITSINTELKIDSIKVKENQRVLIKNQFETISIPNTTDPSLYFKGYYEILEDLGTIIKYSVPSSDNGIYIYKNSRLVRESDIDSYEDILKYSVGVKLGVVNREMQFSLQRLSNGNFPEYLNNEPIYFKEKHNYVLRNRIDYNNIYDLVLNDTLKHATQSFSQDDVTYTIPQRTITIGEFGVIICHQEGITNLISSKYKNNLSGISETSNKYWIVGDNGDVLKISKIDFSVEKIILSEKSIDVNTNLNSISFFNDLKGVIVGDFNNIWHTSDGGYNWVKINLADFKSYTYNKVIYTHINRFYVGGNNGVFIEFIYDNEKWTAYKRRISKFLDTDDEYLLVDDITDLKYFTDTSRILTVGEFTIPDSYFDDFSAGDLISYGGIVYESISGSLGPIPTDTEYWKVVNDKFIAISAKNNNLFLYDIENVLSDYDFLYLGNDNKFGDIDSVGYNSGTYSLFFSTESYLYKLDPIVKSMDKYDNNSRKYHSSTASNVITMSYSIFSTQSGINSIYDYSDTEFIITGNTSLWDSVISVPKSITNVYDEYFFDKIKPSLIFMDYDIGSKLYWFDDMSQYRLPGKYNIPVSYLISSTYSSESMVSFEKTLKYINDPILSITYSFFEENWISYWKDSLKTFEYYTHMDTDYMVEPSFEFKGSDYLSGSFTYSLNDITISYGDIKNLMPATQSSRYRSLSGTISVPSSSYNIYLYDYLAIWKIVLPNSVSGPSKGDVILINSDIISGKFIINKIFTETSGSNIVYYQYFYTNFNQNIINNLSEISGYIELINLNRYPISATNSVDMFISNFNNHYISNAYEVSELSTDYPNPTASPIGVTQSLEIVAKYSQKSAYYNLSTKINALTLDNFLLENKIDYSTPFLNFGYTANYNLLSYLNFINSSIYTPTKEFLALPKYDLVPGSDSGQSNDDIIYIDVIDSNSIIFGKNIKHLWDSFLKWTFIDITINTDSASHKSEKILIIDKYYDSDNDNYLLVFYDKIKGRDNIISVDIHSRRTLQEISDDIGYINNIQRQKTTKKVENIDTTGEYSYPVYESEIKFKIPTDSYTKILLSDNDISRDISGILYTDYKNELAIQINKLEKQYELPIGGVLPSINSKYQIGFSEKHGLNNRDSIVIQLVGTSSNWPIILGYHNINYIDDYTVELNIPFDSFTPPDELKCFYIKKDHFLNFNPIDIFDVGVGDKKIKQSVEILSKNWKIEENNYSLVDMDFTKFKFRLIDGLDLEYLTKNFAWILDAEITNAVIGINSEKELIWYKGVWESGKWFGGRWISGEWKSGDWYGGIWYSRSITDNLLSVKIDNNLNNNDSSIWLSGRWFGGTWNGGTWYDGRWYNGSWNDGIWYNGTWNGGTWNKGIFSGGIWVSGIWNSGIFNSNSKIAYWLDGKFLGGDFENGTWYNGEFNQKNNLISRFGTKSFNSRNATWYAGRFLAGEFHSFLNLDDENLPTISEIHKYSKWYTGYFGGGTFYGGNVDNINFISSTWEGGILNDIDIISINSTDNTLTLDGVYRFNTTDSIHIVDNQLNGTYSVFGTTELPIKYKILETTIDEDLERTQILVDVILDDIMSVNTGIIDTKLKCVSYFSNSTWNSGIWENGIFNKGNFNGGMWYQGNFTGIWG